MMSKNNGFTQLVSILLGNCGVVGGGVITNLEGIVKASFAWGLGNSSNNLVEAYVLWHGLKIAINYGVKILNVVGDSKNVIMHMVLKTTTLDVWIQF
jgi:ribonuclease HI